MAETDWNDVEEFNLAYPRVPSLLGISVILTLILGILSQCLVVSTIIPSSPESISLVFLYSLVFIGMILSFNQFGIVIAFFKLNDWIVTALTKAIGKEAYHQRPETDELRFILTQSYKMSRIKTPQLLIGLIIVIFTIVVPVSYLGGLQSSVQLGLLFLAFVIMSVNLLFDIALRRLERKYQEMHEHDLLEEIHSLTQKKSNTNPCEIDFYESLNTKTGMLYNDLSYVLVFLWIGVTDMIFLI